jgi:hypothetical protein
LMRRWRGAVVRGSPRRRRRTPGECLLHGA